MSPEEAPAQALDWGSLPTSPPNTQSGAFTSGEIGQAARPSRWAGFAERIKEDVLQSGYGQWQTGRMESEAEDLGKRVGQPRLSPEEANKRYPGMPEAFSEPVDPVVAQIRYDNFKHRQNTSEWLMRGGPTPWQDFTAGAIAGALDPINLALGSASGLALGGAARLLKMAPLTGIKGVASVFAQNLAINAASGKIIYDQEKRDQIAPSVSDSVTGAVEGAVGGTALHYGLQYLSKLLGSALERTKNTTKLSQEEAVRTAIAQHEAGAKINPESPILEDQMRRSGRVSSAEVLPENTHYVGATADGSIVRNDDHLGPGVQSSNDGQRMNNLAHSPTDGPGYKVTLKIPEDYKLFDLDKPAKGEPIIKLIEEKMGIKLEVGGQETVKDVIDRLHSYSADPEQWHQAMRTVNETVRNEGYAGYSYKGDTGDSRIHHFLADNRLESDIGTPRQLEAPMLADNRPMPGESLETDGDSVPRLTDQEKQASFEKSLKPENTDGATPEIQQEVEEHKNGKPLNSEPEYMDPIVKAQTDAAMAQLEEYAKNDLGLREELDAIRRQSATDKQELQTMKDLANCVAEGLV